MNRLEKLIALRVALHDEHVAILGLSEKEDRNLTEAERLRCEAICVEVESVTSEIVLREKVQAQGSLLTESAGRVGESVSGNFSVPPDESGGVGAAGSAVSRAKLPAGVRHSGPLRNFRGPDAKIKAGRFGAWCGAALFGNAKLARWCRENNLPLVEAVDSQSEGINVRGGFLVPEELDESIIDLRLDYGVFRRFAQTVPMSSNEKTRNKRETGLTAYFVGEGAAVTKSNFVPNQVRLIAKKISALAVTSSELEEDSVVDFGDLLAGEIAYAFSNKEDDCGFNGTGTSTYGGIVGVIPSFTNLTATIANIAGLFVSTGNLWSELVLSDFTGVIGLLPKFRGVNNVRWYCHPTFWGQVMQKLQSAAGGNTIVTLAGGALDERFLGYPVTFVEVMPKVEGNSQVCALLGDLSRAAMLGDRRGITLATTTEGTADGVSMFDTDQMAVKGTERFDINVHSIGNQSATASLRQAGPVVGLITAAS